MKNRSSSEKIMSQNASYLTGKYKSLKQARLQSQKEELALELSDLKQRIDVSKPMLENIYNKMRKKQQNYQQNIHRQIERGEQRHELTRQYKRLDAEGVKIIAKNNFGDEGSRLSNYRSPTIHQLSIPKNKECSATNNICRHQSMTNINKENIKHSQNYQRILDEYRRPKLAKENGDLGNAFSAKNIYQKYRRKIGSQNRENETTLNKVRRLSKQIDKDIQELKLNKNSSMNNLKSSKFCGFPLTKQTKDRKTYFLQLQKRKLKKI